MGQIEVEAVELVGHGRWTIKVLYCSTKRAGTLGMEAIRVKRYHIFRGQEQVGNSLAKEKALLAILKASETLGDLEALKYFTFEVEI